MMLGLRRPRQVIVVALLTSIFWFMLNIILLYTYQGNIFLSLRQGVQRQGEGRANNLPGNLNGLRLPRGEPHQKEQQKEQQQEHDFLENLPDNKESKEEENEDSNKDNKPEEREKNRIKQHIGNGKSPTSSENSDLHGADQEIKVTEKKDNESIKRKVTVETAQIQPTKEEFKFETEPVLRDPHGPGENGQAVNIEENEKKEESEGYDQHAFNELASRKISLHRSIPDTREPG